VEYCDVAAGRKAVTEISTGTKLEQVIRRCGIELVSYRELWRD